MILHIENSKDTTTEWLELINELGKVAGYRILLPFHALKMKYQREKLRKKIPLTIMSKIVKYLGISLPKGAKSLHSVRCAKTVRFWWKKLKMIHTNGKIYCVFGLQNSILLKWPYYLRQSAESMQSLSNYYRIFHRTRTDNSKFCMET